MRGELQHCRVKVRLGLYVLYCTRIWIPRPWPALRGLWDSIWICVYTWIVCFCVYAYTLWVLAYDELIELTSFSAPLLGSPVLDQLSVFTDDGDCLHQTSQRGWGVHLPSLELGCQLCAVFFHVVATNYISIDVQCQLFVCVLSLYACMPYPAFSLSAFCANTEIGILTTELYLHACVLFPYVHDGHFMISTFQ